LRLREDTRKQHKDAKNCSVERAMLEGWLTVAQYTQVLAQRYLLHEQLDCDPARLHGMRFFRKSPNRLEARSARKAECRK
jgi:heme oxygenase